MRFFIGKHYRDTKSRDGDEVYVGAAISTDVGNLVNIKTGIGYFAEDYVLYQYLVDTAAENCFDAVPMDQDDHRFQPVDVDFSYDPDAVESAGG